MKEFEIELKRIALRNPTTVNVNGREITTQSLDVDTLSELWKWYYAIPPFHKIILVMDKKLYNSITQRTASNNKSVAELFLDNDITCRERGQ